MNLQRTVELGTEGLEVEGEELRLNARSWVANLGKCSECGQWVCEMGTGPPFGHKLECSHPVLGYSWPEKGWLLPWSAEFRIDQALPRLAGLRVQVVRESSTEWYVAHPGPGLPEWGHWDVAEVFMRLGYLPPLEIVESLQVIPKEVEGSRAAHKLWVARGARRAMREKLRRVQEEVERISAIKRAMFPRDTSAETTGRGEFQLGLPLGVK